MLHITLVKILTHVKRYILHRFQIRTNVICPAEVNK